MAGAKHPAKSKNDTGSESNLIVPVLLLLLLGAGAGFAYGTLSGDPHKQAGSSGSAARESTALATADGVPGSEAGGTRNDWRKEELVPLQPLIVRMGGSKEKWLRLEGAVAFSRPSKEDRGTIVAQLGEDLMLFL